MSFILQPLHFFLSIAFQAFLGDVGLYYTDVVFLKSLTNIGLFPNRCCSSYPFPLPKYHHCFNLSPRAFEIKKLAFKAKNLLDCRYCTVQMAITPISMLNACANRQLLSTLRVPSVAFNLPMQSSQLLFDVAKGINSVTQGLFLNQHFPGVLMKQQVCSTLPNPPWELFLFGSRAVVESKPK